MLRSRCYEPKFVAFWLFTRRSKQYSLLLLPIILTFHQISLKHVTFLISFHLHVCCRRIDWLFMSRENVKKCKKKKLYMTACPQQSYCSRCWCYYWTVACVMSQINIENNCVSITCWTLNHSVLFLTSVLQSNQIKVCNNKIILQVKTSSRESCIKRRCVCVFGTFRVCVCVCVNGSIYSVCEGWRWKAKPIFFLLGAPSIDFPSRLQVQL